MYHGLTELMRVVDYVVSTEPASQMAEFIEYNIGIESSKLEFLKSEFEPF